VPHAKNAFAIAEADLRDYGGLYLSGAATASPACRRASHAAR
jgi:hypothetical protein